MRIDFFRLCLEVKVAQRSKEASVRACLLKKLHGRTRKRALR